MAWLSGYMRDSSVRVIVLSRKGVRVEIPVFDNRYCSQLSKGLYNVQYQTATGYRQVGKAKISPKFDSSLDVASNRVG